MGRKFAVAWLIAATVVWVLAGLFGLLLAGFSVMIFDAPGSTENPGAILLFLSIVSFPPACALAILAAWVLFSTNKLRYACWSTLLPLVNPLLAAFAIYVVDTY